MSTRRLPNVDRLFCVLAAAAVATGLLRMFWPVATPDVEPLPLPELSQGNARGNNTLNQAAAFDHYRVVVERSVFSPERRAIPEAAAAPAAAPVPAATQVPRHEAEPVPVASSPPAASFALLGIARAAEQSLALVRNDSTGEYRVLSVNDEAEGWRVRAITGTTLVLHNGEQETTLVLPAVPGGPLQ